MKIAILVTIQLRAALSESKPGIDSDDADDEYLATLSATTEHDLDLTRKWWSWIEPNSYYAPIALVTYKWNNVYYKRSNSDGNWYPMGIVTTDGHLKTDEQTIRNAASIDIAAQAPWSTVNNGTPSFNTFIQIGHISKVQK